MNRLTLFLLLLGFGFLGALIGATPTNAVSQYDNLINPVSQLTIRGPNDSCTANMTYDWSRPIQDQSTWLDINSNNELRMNQMRTSFMSTIGVSNGKWGVSLKQNDNPNIPTGDEYLVWWTTDTPTFEFYDFTGTGVKGLALGNINMVWVVPYGTNPDGSCRMKVQNNEWNPNYYGQPIARMPYGQQQIRPFFATNINIPFPPEYQGLQVPGTPPQLTQDVDYWVDFSYTNTQSSLTSKYLNKKTNPVTNLPDPAVVSWTLWQDAVYNDQGGTEICTQSRPISLPFDTSQACPEFIPDPTKQYFLTSQVNPNNPANQSLFNDESYTISWLNTVYRIDFTKTNAGSTESCEGGAIGGNMSVFCNSPKEFNFLDCMKPDFPFVDIPQCTKTFQILFNYMFLSQTKVPNFTTDSSCHNLNIMDEWLNLPNNYQVCPQIPPYVRNVTTPFVAFLLGLVTIGFIKRVRGDFDG